MPLSERNSQIEVFLAAAGWAEAERRTIAGDASNRRYERLRQKGETLILMDAPAERGEDVRPFLKICRLLRAWGLSAPEVFAADERAGLLLLEDLGDAIFARTLEQDPELEPTLYAAATDVLVHIHQQDCPDLAAYDAPMMTDLAALAFDWYQAGAKGKTDPAQRAAFCDLLTAELAPLDTQPRVVILRDYHAENLVWLPDRAGLKKVGQLDFQDALLGHPAYDLVSILQDARRDLAPETETDQIQRYLTAQDVPGFEAAYERLGIQRNMRILGVFARLSMAYGKPHYVDYIPRVWGHLQRMLDRPGLEDLADLLRTALPAPEQAILDRLRTQCSTPS